MGSSQSKPEFTTVLADKEVEIEDNFILSCKAETENVTVSWEKDDSKLYPVEGKHKVKVIDPNIMLEVKNAQVADGGKYTVTLKNNSGSELNSCSAFITIKIEEWRKVNWRQSQMLDTLRTYKISNEVQELRFLLYGPVGAGKSSTINTIRTIFEGRQFVNCLAAAGSTKSHTLVYKRFGFANDEGSFRFAFNDTMGVEEENGVHCEDIISALKGHIKEGYMFNPASPLSQENRYFEQNPSLNDRIHCLMYVVPADKISLMENTCINKLKSAREAASRMGIPQVVFMTRVDCTCPMTKKNLKTIYKSKKIKDKMHECSNLLGVPMNCIFPVWNYHEESHENEDINCLMLDALTQIIPWANDYVAGYRNNQFLHQHSTSE